MTQIELTRGVDQFERVGTPGVIHLFEENAKATIVSIEPIHEKKQELTAPHVVVASWEEKYSVDHQPRSERAINIPVTECRRIQTESVTNGRVVAIAHEGYISKISSGDADIPQATLLLRNTVNWICGTKHSCGKHRIAVLGKPLKFLSKFLKNIGLHDKIFPCEWDVGDSVEPPSALLWMGTQGSGNVCEIADAYKYKEIISFIQGGGGLLVAMCPWGFEQITKADLSTQCAQNHVLRHFGMAFGNEYVNSPYPFAVLKPEFGEDIYLELPRNCLSLSLDICKVENILLDGSQKLSDMHMRRLGVTLCSTLSSLPLNLLSTLESGKFDGKEDCDKNLDLLFGKPGLQLIHFCQQLISSDTSFCDALRACEKSALRSILIEPPHPELYHLKMQNEDPRQDAIQRIASVLASHGIDCFSFRSSFEGSPIAHISASVSLPGASIFPSMGMDLSSKSSDLVQDHRINLFSKYDGEWVSTGCYLVPNTNMSMTVLEGDCSHWKVRVGCHSDVLWHLSEWRRWPSISQTFPFNQQSERLEITYPWGGIVYLQHSSTEEGKISLSISNVLLHAQLSFQSPDMSTWTVRLQSAPWCELEGNHCIFSVPSVALLSNPKLNTRSNILKALEFWDNVLTTHYSLVDQCPPSRKERVVTDVQLAAGYMHAGYPIMVHLDQIFKSKDGSPSILDADRLLIEGSWGIFHEFGHHIQDPRWTFEGTGEVTVNFFTLYTMCQMIGIKPWNHPWLEAHKSKACTYLQDQSSIKNKFKKWQSDPGLALVTYARLQHEFGWDAFKTCFRLYNCLDEDTSQVQSGAEHVLPMDVTAKVTMFAHLFSRAVEVDLSAYFVAWGWPISEKHLREMPHHPPSRILPSKLEKLLSMK